MCSLYTQTASVPRKRLFSFAEAHRGPCTARRTPPYPRPVAVAASTCASRVARGRVRALGRRALVRGGAVAHREQYYALGEGRSEWAGRGDGCGVRQPCARCASDCTRTVVICTYVLGSVCAVDLAGSVCIGTFMYVNDGNDTSGEWLRCHVKEFSLIVSISRLIRPSEASRRLIIPRPEGSDKSTCMLSFHPALRCLAERLALICILSEHFQRCQPDILNKPINKT